MVQDLRYAVRSLRKNPGFAAACVGTMSLGIGAVAVIFAVLDAIVLKPLAYRDADRLFVVHEIIPSVRDRYPLITVNAGHFAKWREHVTAFEDSAALEFTTEDLTGGGEPERVGVARVTVGLFNLLGMPPQQGRMFIEADGQPGQDQVVLLSDDLWRRRFGGDPAVIGRAIQVSGQPVTIVGVLPAGAQLPRPSEMSAIAETGAPPDLFRPLAFTAKQLAIPGNFNYSVIVRLRGDRTPAQALAELNAVQARMPKLMPAPPGLEANLSPMKGFMVRRVSDGLWMLMIAVATVLLIICVNLANLLLARNAHRRQEFALRAALGAGRARLLRQLLVESLLLASIGGALGITGAYLALGAVLRTAPVDLPRTQEIAISPTVLAFALGLALLAGLSFGLLPALRLHATAPGDALRSGGRTTADPPSGARMRTLLIAGQVALCTMLVVTCGLLLGSFAKIMAVDRGFEVTQIASADLLLSTTRYQTLDQRTAFFRALLPQLEAVPGVRAAAMIQVVPLRGVAEVNLVSRPGDVRRAFERPVANYSATSPRYFETLGIPLRRGRLFQESDEKRKVAIVSEKAARELWPGVDPIGQTFHQGDTDDPLIEVIGVVADVRSATLDAELTPIVYTPYWQKCPQGAAIVIKGNVAPSALASALRGTLQSLDREMPIPQIRTMETVVSDSVANRRFQLLVVVLFAACAVLLATLGIFGVISHLVAQRTSEIGVRMALGAQASDLRRLVLGQGLRPVVAGLVVGAVGALAAGHALRSMLFSVSPFDPTILFGATAVLALFAAAACYLPAQRATRIDPLTALRSE